MKENKTFGSVIISISNSVILKIADIENSISMILRKFKYSVIPKYHSRQKPSVTPLQAMALT
ncbi:hypothetical protein BpHYR1_002421 [Brachionus plicatilis]|uniref:Uncharacterized protein n=1 Tax=Brachionus plicatilis TaxID=10195 RepID=A0A3M7PR86_BRAPC|nr:hypothetical protein BpHYR1_002421 [Brachionus plicatilis]